MVVTPLLRVRFLGHGPSDRARVYRPAKRRNHRPPKCGFSHRPNFLPCGGEGRVPAARREQTGMPGGRLRMTTGGLSAQSLILPPGKALLIGTAKSTSFHLLMGMRCDQRPAFFGLTCERERFMPIRGMSRRVCSRNGEVVKPCLKPYADPVESRRVSNADYRQVGRGGPRHKAQHRLPCAQASAFLHEIRGAHGKVGHADDRGIGG